MTDAIKETPTTPPDNPFTYGKAEGRGAGMEWLEYQSTLVIPTAPTVGERRNMVKQQPMRLDAIYEHFPRVLQLFRRCEYFEKECQRLEAGLARRPDVEGQMAELTEGRKRRTKEG